VAKKHYRDDHQRLAERPASSSTKIPVQDTMMSRIFGLPGRSDSLESVTQSSSAVSKMNKYSAQVAPTAANTHAVQA